MSAENNKELVRKIFHEGINKQQHAAIESIIDPGYINHGIPGDARGAEGFSQIVRQFTDSFPDLTITLEEVIGDGDTVATRGTWTGTHKGDFMGMPSTGKQVKVSFMDFWKFRNGKAVENWVQMDIAGLMQQLGAMPS